MPTPTLLIPTSKRLKATLPPGVRIRVRGEEWVVRSCEQDHELDARIVTAEGVGGLTRGLSMVFLDCFEAIEVVDPLAIRFEPDQSAQFRRTGLWIDLWARRVLPTDNQLVVGHRGVFKQALYQLVPAFKALNEEQMTRPRILLADAVGLGKTIQVGVLLSELIKRGRGRRILVVCLKSMLTQFQKEIWSRFGIALEAFNRQRIEALYREIPSQANPFDHRDRIIMSMDTLKSPRMLEKLALTHWDVIVIDECHNVARRGNAASMRARLARELASISDSLILTSATPHDGSRDSYASLLELIDPLKVTDPKNITQEDLKPLVVRRFHKEVQTEMEIPLRKEHPAFLPMLPGHEQILKSLRGKVFSVLDRGKTRRKDVFFRSTLAKLLYSSPEAFRSSLEARLKKLNNNTPDAHHRDDAEFLSKFLNDLGQSTIKETPKYIRLVDIIKDIHRQRKRVVVFTEFLQTQSILAAALSEDLGLGLPSNEKEFDRTAEIAIFHGGMPEQLQNEIIEDFGSQSSKIKILIASDAASEGVNLHFFCHHVIHFDVPWSLITIEQRNGRIDRYGQQQQPQIFYLVNKTDDPELKFLNEAWVVRKLLDKAKESRDQLGDPALALRCFSADKETEAVTLAVQEEDDPIKCFPVDAYDEIFGAVNDIPGSEVKMLSTFRQLTDKEFAEELMIELGLRPKVEDGAWTFDLTGDDLSQVVLARCFAPLHAELNIQKKKTVSLSPDATVVNREILNARKKAGKWPEASFWWEIHPVVSALEQLLENTFERDKVPVVVLEERRGTIGFLVYSAAFNQRGQPALSRLQVAIPDKGKWVYLSCKEGLETLGLRSNMVNPGHQLSANQISTLKTQAQSLYKDLTGKDSELKRQAYQQSQRKDVYRRTMEHQVLNWRHQREKYLAEVFASPSKARRLEEEKKYVARLVQEQKEYAESHFDVQYEHPYIRFIVAFIGA